MKVVILIAAGMVAAVIAISLVSDGFLALESTGDTIPGNVTGGNST